MIIKRIALLGGESTGKSTLAVALAQQLNTCYTTEYGRDFWLEKQGKLAFEDFLFVAKQQILMEDNLAVQANHYLVCDTTPLTTLFYALDTYGKADPKLYELAQRHYDYTFLCLPDFPFVQDGARTSQDYRARQHEWYKRELQKRKISYIEVGGTVEERVENICKGTLFCAPTK